jgi:hypothetical protein
MSKVENETPSNFKRKTEEDLNNNCKKQAIDTNNENSSKVIQGFQHMIPNTLSLGQPASNTLSNPNPTQQQLIRQLQILRNYQVQHLKGPPESFLKGNVVVAMTQIKFGPVGQNELIVNAWDDGLVKTVYVDGTYGIVWRKYPKQPTTLRRSNSKLVKLVHRPICEGYQECGHKCTNSRSEDHISYCSLCMQREYQLLK